MGIDNPKENVNPRVKSTITTLFWYHCSHYSCFPHYHFLPTVYSSPTRRSGGFKLASSYTLTATSPPSCLASLSPKYTTETLLDTFNTFLFNECSWNSLCTMILTPSTQITYCLSVTTLLYR